MELRYLRDREKREVDFVVLRENKPLFAVECKSGEKNLSKNLLYFSERAPIPKFYQVDLGVRDFEKLGGKIRVLPFEKFCKEIEAV